MKKIMFFSWSLLLAVVYSQAQTEVSHAFKQEIEVSTDNGGPIKIMSGESATVAFIGNGTENFRISYLRNGKKVTRAIQLVVKDNRLVIPAANDADVVVVAAESNGDRKLKATTQQITHNTTPNTTPNTGPSNINYIASVKARIPVFQLKLVNMSSKDLLFIGDVFTGVAIAAPTMKDGALVPSDTIISMESVRPGLTEINVIYKKIVTGEANGQQFILAQQALAFVVIDSSQVITINDNDFFDFSSLVGNTPIRFKNVGTATLYPKSSNKKLKPLRKGRVSKVVDYNTAQNTTWYYYSQNNVQKMGVWELAPGERPIINISAMEKLYNVIK